MPDYADVADRLSGGGPLAHWRLGDAAGSARLAERVRGRHAAIDGTVRFGVAGLPDNSDAAIDFGGTGSATVAHDAGLELAAFTLSFWLKLNALPAGDVIWHIINKGEAGNFDGDILVRLDDEGSLEIQLQSATTGQHSVSAGGLDTGRAYHVCVRADGAGFDAYLDAQFLGKNTGFLGAITANHHDLQFAAAPFSVEPANVVLDEILLYDRKLSEREVLTLAQRTRATKAVDDAVRVPGGATTPIQVLANDTYVGTPELSIEDQPEGGDRAEPEDLVINYTAGAVAENTRRSFRYRITDQNGQSNIATVQVTVRATAAPVVSNANCFPATGASEKTLAAGWTPADLQEAVNTAPRGRHILIPPGTKPGGTITLKPAGTGDPVVIRPQGAVGSVTINDANWTVATGSERLVISKLNFRNGHIELNGTNHRVTRCRFTKVNGYCVGVRNGDFVRVDHCDMSDWQNTEVRKGFVDFMLPDFILGGHGDVLVDYNYLHDYSSPPGSANAANVFNTSSGSRAWRTHARVEFSHNLVRNATPLRDAEFLTTKFSGVLIAFNTFENVDGYVQQRQGGGWEVRSNWFEKMGNAAPLKCFDDLVAGNHTGAGRALVIANRLVGDLDMWIGSGDNREGGPGNPKGNYHPSRQGRYIANIVGGQIHVGRGFGGFDTHPAEDNNLWNNRVGGEEVPQNKFGGNLVDANQTGTTFNQDNEASDEAVKILEPTGNPATDLVGPLAPDPLCPV